MNRAERRRTKGNVAKPKTYVLTEDQIAQLKQDATSEAFGMLLSIPLTVLHDKFGFDDYQMDQFLHYALMWVDGVQKGEVTLNEVLEICENEVGIPVINKEDNKRASTRGNWSGLQKRL